MLGVRKDKISTWHKAKLIVGERSIADNRKVYFDLAEVREAIIKHNLRVAPEVLATLAPTVEAAT